MFNVRSSNSLHKDNLVLPLNPGIGQNSLKKVKKDLARAGYNNVTFSPNEPVENNELVKINELI